MKAILFLIPVLSIAQSNPYFNVMVKDSTLLQLAKNNIYPIPAIEIAVKSTYQESNTLTHPIRIAIDPGHIASNKKEAIIEERFIRYNNKFFYESQLNETTALVLKKKLEERGFVVSLSRQPKKTAFGYTYTYWYKKLAKKELSEKLNNNLISQDTYNDLIKSNKKELFDKYFKNQEFIKRAHNINAFQPDFVIIIHYNASEFENNHKTNAPLVEHNYTVAFVPGSFTNIELASQSQINDFIRISTTDILKKSIELSESIVTEIENKLNIPRLKPSDYPELWYLKKFSVYTGKPGVFARNLYLTRTIKAPLAYIECTLQNNKQEIQYFTKKDTKIYNIKTSSRILNYTDAIYTGIIKYMQNAGWLK